MPGYPNIMRDTPADFDPDQFAIDLDQARKIAKLMDSNFTFMGVSFGWDAILGIVPVAGDTLALLPALFPLYVAKKHKLPAHIIARMTVNVITDYGIGLVPVAGDVFDVAFRASLRNVRLLEEWAAKQEKKRARIVPGEVVR